MPEDLLRSAYVECLECYPGVFVEFKRFRERVDGTGRPLKLAAESRPKGCHDLMRYVDMIGE